MADVTWVQWFYVVVGGGAVAGIVNSIIQVFVQRFIAKPLDRRLEALTVLIYTSLNEKEKRDFAEVEKKLLKLKGE